MQIVLITNIFVHYELNLMEAFNRVDSNADVYFVATQQVPRERLKLGFDSYDSLDRKHYIRTYESEAEKARAQKIIDTSDIILAGDSSDQFCLNNGNGIVFHQMEAFFQGDIKDVGRKIKWNKIAKDYARKHYYYLAISAYVAYDLKKSWKDIDLGRIYKWAYFSKTNTAAVDRAPVEQNIPLKFLWVGRFLEWKHPEYAIETVRYVIQDLKKPAELTIVGTGDENYTEHLKSYVSAYKLDDYVNFAGSVPSEEVAEFYKASDIYLFTSDGREGWGVVLNEAMANQCAVVASDAPGSSLVLVKDGQNGLIYHDNNIDELKAKVKQLIDNPSLIRVYGHEAEITLQEIWNAENAARDLIELSNSLREGRGTPFREGPCSRAELVGRSEKAFG